MKIRLLTSLSGPDRNHHFGEISEFADDEAVRLIESGLAEPARHEAAENTSAPPHTEKTVQQLGSFVAVPQGTQPASGEASVHPELINEILAALPQPTPVPAPPSAPADQVAAGPTPAASSGGSGSSESGPAGTN